CVAMLVEGYW
nr:immunoglobulin heavy chain junction region [Mus musculus]NSM09177.1 immunoglobulin heavy chain junction region [Mus musculus]NSM09675.1 immunoglobulin heavy chain junction region [Mus musculus]